MKKFKNTFVSLTAGLLMAGLTLTFNACTEQSPYEPVDNQAADSNSSLNKKAQGRESKIYPQSASMTLRYQSSQNQYGNGKMSTLNGSSFQVDNGSLTPPPGTPQGQKVTLTMAVDKDEATNELIFTFGPSGSQFNRGAELWFDWHELGSRNAKLFLIDADGNYIEKTPEYEDKRGHRFMVHVYHFSRYAVAWSN